MTGHEMLRALSKLTDEQLNCKIFGVEGSSGVSVAVAGPYYRENVDDEDCCDGALLDHTGPFLEVYLGN